MMATDEFYLHSYRPIVATCLSEALARFAARYGYYPDVVACWPGAPVNGGVRTIERREIPLGIYYCSIREEV